MVVGGGIENVEVIGPREFAPTVADELVASIGEVLDQQESCSICLSGGTTPAAVYRLLGIPPRVQDIEWSKVKLFWGDERWVPKDDDKSNYHMVQQTLLSQLPDSDVVTESVNTTLESPKKGAADYAKRIRSHGYYEKEGSSSPFDIVLLGLGEDGHYASVFPGDKSGASADLCFSTKNPSDGTERVSIAPDALFASPRVFFIVAGESKASVLSQLFLDPTARKELPAGRAFDHSENVLWMIDSSAAKELPRGES